MNKLLDLIESEHRKCTREYMNAASIKEKKRISERILALDIVLYKAIELELEDSTKYDDILKSLNSNIVDIVYDLRDKGRR